MKPHEHDSPVQDPSQQLRAGEKSGSQKVISIVLALALFVATGLAVERIGGLVGLFPGSEADQVSEKQVRDRQQAYVRTLPIQLKRVLPDEMASAVASMELPPDEQKSLLAELQQKHAAKDAVNAVIDPLKATPNPAAKQEGKSVLLAWMTLWDTDAVDNDIVRINSSGYSRTVTLTKQPITFAVPVPDNGIINITGIHDGGGGITVGAISGATPVALPIMSEGQVIGIPMVIR